MADADSEILELKKTAANRVKSTVYTRTGNGPWSVTQTPREVWMTATDARVADEPFIELTLMFHTENNGWNGKAIFIDPFDISEIAPAWWGYEDDDDDD